MRGRRRPRSIAAQRGAAAVEFAIILPLMLLVIAGIVDFGRASFTQIQLTNAAREGARAAIVSGVPSADVTARASAAAVGVPGFTANLAASCPGSNATVTAAAPFDWVMLGPAMNLVGGGGALPTKLESQAVMKCSG